MSGDTRAHSTVRILLGILFAINVAWIAVSSTGDPGSFAFLYGIAWFLGARRYRYVPVFVVGLLGVGLHIYDIFAGRTGTFDSLDMAFLYANLVLPLPLIVAALRATRVQVAHRPSRTTPR